MEFSATKVTIEDHNKGCYPLRLDEDRIDGFQHALVDVILLIDEIIKLLLRYPAWCSELQDKLNEIYNLPRRT